METYMAVTGVGPEARLKFVGSNEKPTFRIALP